MSNVTVPQDAPTIRLCHVIKWPDYEGFGFNLHTEKSKPGQYLGKIDPGSPAQLAGLKEGDRIVEVNGINISNENHKQVVERIKAVSNETKLLVVDPLADTWYKEHKIIIKNNLSSVKQSKTPVPRPKKKHSTSSTSSSGSAATARVSPTSGASPAPPASTPSSNQLLVVPPAGAPAPRLCHVVRRSDFDGYGFNLHADKSRNVQYVGAVDKGSPAEAAGLRPNDTIVEVNGVNVEGSNHKEIVERIKAVANETRLLVVDDGTAAWYRENKVPIRGNLPNIIQLSSVKGNRRPSEHKSAVSAAEPALGPRLCHLSKWNTFEGYGFNLHADKKRLQHFIGQVDPGSPADLGGLRRNDRLVEVNGTTVEGENHRDIIERIKRDPSRVDLLVVDEETEKALVSKKIKISSKADNVIHRRTPPQQPGTEQKTAQQTTEPQDDLSKSSTPRFSPSPESTPPSLPHVRSGSTTAEDDDRAEVESSASVPPPETATSEEGDDRSTPRMQTPVPDVPPASTNGHHGSPADSPVTRSPPDVQMTKTSSATAAAAVSRGHHEDFKMMGARGTKDQVVQSSTATKSPGGQDPAVVLRNGGTLPPGSDGLNFGMKASELRELLRSRKKKDPRELQMDLRQKYKIIEQM
ncbi:Na(+)/H(+) exchange regulatory cofactor-like protein nrfl-1 [Ixodes scapularis]